MSISRYKIHLLAGVVLFPFLIISAMTGFFRANHKWFWKEDYKKVKNTSYSYNISEPAIGVDSLYKIATAHYDDNQIQEVRLRQETGALLYEVRSKGRPSILIDAMSGKLMSPISAEFASRLATQYVPAGAIVSSVVKDNNYLTRKEKKPRPVYVVSFADEHHTQILLDVNTGEIEEEIDDNLKFGFWMVKLHDYDFWTLKRSLLSFVGLGLTIVGVTGFYLWLRKKKQVVPKRNSQNNTSDTSRAKLPNREAAVTVDQ